MLNVYSDFVLHISFVIYVFLAHKEKYVGQNGNV